MNTITNNTTSRGLHRGIWIGGGLMALTIVALATALVMKGHGDAPATDALLTTPGAASTAMTADGTQGTPPTQVAQTTTGTNPEHGGAHHGPNRREHEREHDREGNGGAGADGASGGPNAGVANESTAAPAQVASVCTTCGVIDSYSAVTVQGQNNGIGAVAGGIGGALIGSKIGGRGNHTAGGLIGAVGGGLLGNAIESHERKSTVYDVHVRMNDGSVRTIRQATIPQVGTHVRVDGNTMTVDAAQG